MAAARWPARSEPANNQLALPMAHGRIWFSTQLLPGMLFVRAARRARRRDAAYRAGSGIGASGACLSGRPALDNELRARVVNWPPLRLARMRCERESVVVVLLASFRRFANTEVAYESNWT